MRYIPGYLWAQAWYWRLFLAEFVCLRWGRWRYGHLYQQRDKNPFVSVVIPTLNRGRLLVERTLPSVFAQTYQNFEVVIVGDHSPQETVDWISQVKDPRVRFYNLPKRGRYPKDPRRRWAVAGSAPLRKAEKMVQGEWIAPLDDDDVFTADRIETLLRFAQQGDYELVAGAFMEERTPGILTPGIDPLKNWTFATRSIRSSWLYRSYLRCIKLDLHCWRYNLNGDQSIKKRFFRAGVRMEYLDHIVTHKLIAPGEKFLYAGQALDAARHEAHD